MEINYRLLQILVLVMTAVVFTASMKCNKLILSDTENSATPDNGATINDVLETGQYMVRTIRRTDSASVIDLISKLHGASGIEYNHKSFTAFLQPKDLKKVCNLVNNCFIHT